MDFFDRTGRMAIGSRLRALTDRIAADAAEVYALYGLDFKPKWFPVYFALENGQVKTISAIAKEIGHSHPSVSSIVKEMRSHGMVEGGREGADGRCNIVRLTRKGAELAPLMQQICRDVDAAVGSICREAAHDLWRAIGEWEYLLAEKPLLERVKQARSAREQAAVEIVPYTSEYRQAFRELNEHWIKSHWELEPHDVELLSNPQSTIIDKGGFILVALHGGNPVGVCAMVRMADGVYDYELAKLAVDPSSQGLGIGMMLCRAAIEKAARGGAKKLFLESNTILRPAIHLYRKLGFRELTSYHPAYARGDIQMELTIP